MLIAKEQLQALIDNYLKKDYSNDQKIGFIDGVEKVMELISKLNNK